MVGEQGGIVLHARARSPSWGVRDLGPGRSRGSSPAQENATRTHQQRLSGALQMPTGNARTHHA